MPLTNSTVNIQNLKTLVGTTMVDSELAFFVVAGKQVVDENLLGSALSQSMIDLIATYLSAHFFVLSVEGGGRTYVRAGQSETRFKTSGGAATYGFMATRFGQSACGMDSTGSLARLSAAIPVKFDVQSFSAVRTSKPIGVAS
jgi:hypothetical protein